MQLEAVTYDEFVESLGPEPLPPDVERRIRSQLEAPGSYVNQMLTRLQRVGEDPFDIDWFGLLTEDGDTETRRGSKTHQRQQLQPVNGHRGLLPAMRRRATIRRIAIAASVLFITASAAAITWAVLHEPPLFHDRFDNNWIDSTLWTTPRAKVKELNQHLWLQNRGCVVTTEDFAEPIAVSFRWRWIDLEEFPAYTEVLTVALRTTGEMASDRPFEMRDGLLVKIDAQEGSARVRHHPMKPGEPELGGVASGTLPLPANEWHDVRITDDGRRIALYIKGPAIGDKYWERPVMEIPYRGDFRGGRIAIYNREIVARAQHLSHIDDFVIRRLHSSPAER